MSSSHTSSAFCSIKVHVDCLSHKNGVVMNCSWRAMCALEAKRGGVSDIVWEAHSHVFYGGVLQTGFLGGQTGKRHSTVVLLYITWPHLQPKKMQHKLLLREQEGHQLLES